MPDQQNVVVLSGEPTRLMVHLGHQRAGRVDRPQRPGVRLLVDLRRDAVGREDHDSPLRDLVVLLDEDRAGSPEHVDDVPIVHDLLADVDGGTVEP